MINNKKKKILQIDLNGTSPVYTAYINDALIRIGCEAVISGINRNVRSDLKTAYTFGLDRSLSVRNGIFKKILKFLEYFINWTHSIMIAPRFDAVHIQWLPLLQFNSIDLFFLNRLLARNPNVGYEVHNIFPHGVTSKKIKHRFYKLYTKIPKLIVHTEKSKQDLINHFGISDSKITVMPLGPLYHEWADDKPVIDAENKTIGMIGVIRSYKGVEDAIEALKLLCNNDKKTSLLLAGNGPSTYLKQLDDLIDENKLDNNVKRIYRFLPDEEMVRLYKQCRVILAPYKDIEQSGAVTTSLTLGIPVAGYKIGGLPEIVRNGINGELVKYGDIQGLSDAVIKILDKDPITLHKNCRQSMEHITWNKNAELLRDCYCI